MTRNELKIDEYLVSKLKIWTHIWRQNNTLFLFLKKGKTKRPYFGISFYSFPRNSFNNYYGKQKRPRAFNSQSGVLSILRTAYVDDTTLFVVKKKSVTVVLQTFECFSHFLGLKPKKSRSEEAIMGVVQRINLKTDTNCMKFAGMWGFSDPHFLAFSRIRTQS